MEFSIVLEGIEEIEEIEENAMNVEGEDADESGEEEFSRLTCAISLKGEGR